MVDPEVLREVVPRPGRHADEGHPALDGDRRHQRLGPVATGHAEAVGAPGDSIAGELFEIEAVVEHHGFDTELVRQLDDAELLDLPASRPGVADQHGAARAGHGMRPGRIEGMQIPDEGHPCRPGHDGCEDNHQSDSKNGLIAVRRTDHRGDDRAQSHDCCGESHPATRGPFGDKPPRPGDAHGKTGDHHDERDEVLDREQDERDGEQQRATDRQPSQRSVPARHGRVRVGADGGSTGGLGAEMFAHGSSSKVTLEGRDTLIIGSTAQAAITQNA